MSNSPLPTELDDRWILNLRSLSITQITVDFRLTLALSSDWLVTLETPAELMQGPGRTESNPGFRLTPETQDVAPALTLFGSKILSAVAFKTGTLRLVFDNGMHLKCRSHPEFVAWQITGPEGQRIVSMPDGELALRFDAEGTERHWP
ncbi:hypothetical protein DN069_20455 [Streptacidiphilus pinicola]|uniref:Uncharacterized protein n=1 Tax=Streptacidiphilus pinicola TaxID=2219663 RepID=A0A2X0IFI5_9ACTN|nr:DUF6188 family protein [Streptacidiphilus pinicola]RAG83812.1 hypothetical protein DN069_20455 [Streptacidiphilus pinicola]